MDKKITLAGIFSLIAVGAAIVLYTLFGKAATLRGTAYLEPYPAAPDFQLKDANGKLVRLSDYHGKIVLLFFGYTFCPDVCPTTLAELKQTVDKVGDRASQVQVIFISVDPDRDTSEIMQNYVERFSPDFLGLSGSLMELSNIWGEYDIYREVEAGTSPSNYIVNHTARVILVDQVGNMRLSYGFQTPPEDIANDIMILLDQ
ncbi:MAG: SCO family protein [Anaerolineales bacterium]